jgi:hypothetical protein
MLCNFRGNKDPSTIFAKEKPVVSSYFQLSLRRNYVMAS